MLSRITKSLSRIREEGLIKPHHRRFILHHVAAFIGAIGLVAGLILVTNIHSNAQVTPYKEVLDAHNYPRPQTVLFRIYGAGTQSTRKRSPL